MALLLKGMPVAKALCEKLNMEILSLKEKNIYPCLGILRIGEKADDLSYERSVIKRCEGLGIAVKKLTLTKDVSRENFFEALSSLNKDPSINGILMFRPLPSHLDEEKARNFINPQKDIDCCSDISLAKVFTGNFDFAPCTAKAVMELLDFYNINCEGKKVAIIGRSLVIGKPVSMMLLQRNATVAICHSKTKDLSSITKNADIVISACGKMESLNGQYFSKNQVIIDVGISWNEQKQKLCGDVLFEEAEELASAISPVPGGVGILTTAILAKHIVKAASLVYNQ